MQQLLNERQQVMAEREKRERDWQALKAKYVQKSHTLKEVSSAQGPGTAKPLSRVCLYVLHLRRCD